MKAFNRKRKPKHWTNRGSILSIKCSKKIEYLLEDLTLVRTRYSDKILVK